MQIYHYSAPEHHYHWHPINAYLKIQNTRQDKNNNNNIYRPTEHFHYYSALHYNLSLGGIL